MFKNSYVAKINQNVYIESQKIFGFPKNFLSFKMILDKTGGQRAKIILKILTIFMNSFLRVTTVSAQDNTRNYFCWCYQKNHSADRLLPIL